MYICNIIITSKGDFQCKDKIITLLMFRFQNEDVVNSLLCS